MTVPQPDTSIIFFHIPKTGGITLNSIIERQYDPSVVYSIYGPQAVKYADEFKNMPLEQRTKYKLLKGHMWLKLKLHEYMPQPCTYITVFRDPIEKTISLYYYILRTPSHYLYEKIVSQKMTLKEFASSGLPETSNAQTGILLDDSFKPGQNQLENAKNNIKKYFSLVGVLDKFDEFLLLAQRMFGWKDITYTKQNVTENRPSKKDLPRGTLAVLKKYNQLDMELYEFAKKRMNDLITEYGPSFKREAYIFRKDKHYWEMCVKERTAKIEVIQNQDRQRKDYKNNLQEFKELSNSIAATPNTVPTLISSLYVADILKDIGKDWPPDVKSFLKRAEDLIQKGSPTDFIYACDALDAALRLVPTNSLLLIMRGKVLLQLGDRESARSDFKKAIELSPDYLTTLLDLIDLKIFLRCISFPHKLPT